VTAPSSMSSTTRSTIPWREWWREQSVIDGTDWKTIIDGAELVLQRLRKQHIGGQSS
jgi:hypothetical protein